MDLLIRVMPPRARGQAITAAIWALAACIVLALSPHGSAETTLEKIRRTGKVTVGTEAAFPPFEYVEDGKIVGYGKDILTYIIDDLNVELTQLDLPWQGILPGLLAGKFDFVATTVMVNEARVKKYAFTVPIAEGTSWLMKRAGDDRIGSAEDTAGMVVGTQLASAAEAAARAFEANVLQPGRGTGFRELRLYPAFPDTYIALANGELDAVIQPVPNLAVLIKNRPGMFELVGPIVDKSYMGWVTRPEDKDLRDYLSSRILEMRDSGYLYELQDKWFGFRTDIPDSGYLPAGAH